MAFETADKLAIAQISGLRVIDVDTHLTTFAPTISAEAEAAVLTLIERYNDLPEDNGLEVFPNTANFGARVRNARTVALENIRAELFGLLSMQMSGSSLVYMERG